jgi:hypothetical protein
MARWLGDPGEDRVDVTPLKERVKHYLFSWKVNKVVSSFMEFYNANKDKKLHPTSISEIEALLKNFALGFPK